MFSFEGDFRTRPSVSLGGASKKVKTKACTKNVAALRNFYF